MTSSTQNPLNILLDKIYDQLVFTRTFIGVCLNKKGQMTILKDEATGKFTWYASCALIHAEFVNRMQKDPATYSGCDFYALNGENYMKNKLLINLYENKSLSVTPEMLIVLNGVELNFHKKSSIGMFMPTKLNLDKLYEKIKSDPSKLFEATLLAKDIVFQESEPCTSCGVMCFVPDMERHPNASPAAIKHIENVKDENKQFCFDCGRSVMINLAKYKMAGCTDLNKINTVRNMIIELEKLDLNNPKFDFDKAQNVMKTLMSHVSKASMIVVENDNVSIHKVDDNKPAYNLTKTTEVAPWMN